MSTETALHHFVRRVKGAPSSKGESFGAFVVVDIEGAFDNTSFHVICLACYSEFDVCCHLSQKCIQAEMLHIVVVV